MPDERSFIFSSLLQYFLIYWSSELSWTIVKIVVQYMWRGSFILLKLWTLGLQIYKIWISLSQLHIKEFERDVEQLLFRVTSKGEFKACFYGRKLIAENHHPFIVWNNQFSLGQIYLPNFQTILKGSVFNVNHFSLDNHCQLSNRLAPVLQLAAFEVLFSIIKLMPPFPPTSYILHPLSRLYSL